MSTYKNVLRKAAHEAREHLLSQEFLTPEASDCILTSCSRAVFSQNVDFANFLCRRHAVARDHLKIQNQRVFFVNASMFSLAMSGVRHQHFSNKINQCQDACAQLPSSSSRRQKFGAGISFISRVIRQWVPISKFVTITAILDSSNPDISSGIVSDNATSVMRSLAVHSASFLSGERDTSESAFGSSPLESLELN